MLAGGGQAVHGDDPGRAGAGHEPGRERAEFARDPDLGVVEVEGAARVADVEVRREPGTVPGLQRAVRDAFEAAYDGVGAVLGGVEDRADDGVGAVARQPVAAGAERGQVPGEGDPAGRGAVHGEPGFGGQRPAGGALSAASLASRPAATLAAPAARAAVRAAAVAVTVRMGPVSWWSPRAASGRWAGGDGAPSGRLPPVRRGRGAMVRSRCRYPGTGRVRAASARPAVPRSHPPASPAARTPGAAPPPPPTAPVSGATGCGPGPRRPSARAGTSTPAGRCGRTPGRGRCRR